MDVDAAAKFYGKEVRNKQQVKFMKIDKMYVDFQLKKSRFRVRDIINNGNIIGKPYKLCIHFNAQDFFIPVAFKKNSLSINVQWSLSTLYTFSM